MTTQHIEYNGILYPIQEPTIEMWSNVMKLKDILDEDQMFIRMISLTTGLSVKDVQQAPASEIRKVGNTLYEFINGQNRKLYKTIEHKGKKYNLVDVHKVSFGQFIDIDTYLGKDESYRISNLHELASYFYTEEGKEYGIEGIQEKMEDFKSLPMKYVEGAVFFLLNLGLGLHQLSLLYSKSKLMWMILKMRIRFLSIGVGIQQYRNSHKTKFGRLIALPTYPLYLVLTTFRTFWISLMRGKNK